MNKTIGVLAHVDAGKTTFSEQVLYRTGAIRTPGRVDHHSAFLDSDPIERERGITVFADQAAFSLNGDSYQWVDTPGHADFSAEMERVLPVLDYAVLIISCTEGVQSHTATVWRLLEAHRLPVFVFVNKTDRPDADYGACLAELRRRLSADLVDLNGFRADGMDEACAECAAERDEALLERWLDGNYDFAVWREGMLREIQERRLFPVFSGAALTGEGVDRFLAALSALTRTDYECRLDAPLGGRVYKIRHDAQGTRLCDVKLMSGRLRLRGEIELGETRFRVGEMRRRHGGKSFPVTEACAGELITLTGLPGVSAGDGFGSLYGSCLRSETEPMLSVSVEPPEGMTRARLNEILKIIEEEDPALRLESDAQTGEMRLHVMGAIQIEILSRVALERFGVQLHFGPARILYMETIAAPAVGVGHYEPLRHYAEVWLRLSPGPRGSGIRFASKCPVETLSLNFQRLVETHIFERPLCGVLTGAPLTDVSIELLVGRAHLKHTEGGDFRESTHRAVRNALMQAKSVLLEPVCSFQLRVPEGDYGRVMGDLLRLHADTEPPRREADEVEVSGSCPYRRFAAYPEQFRAAAHGRGSLSMQFSRYAEMDSPEDVIRAAAYNPQAADTPDSVFCAHGAGFVVPWQEVRAHAHCEVELPEE